MNIFLSYGHDEYTEDALRIKADLQARGHQVWFDVERLREGRDWETYIEGGLRGCDKMVLLMTPHSVRRRNRHDPESRDGYCLNEIAKALEWNKMIIPVLLTDLEDGPPTSICRIQYLDMRDAVPISEHEKRYQMRFNRLVDALEKDDLDFEGGQARLKRLLRPIDFSQEFRRHIGVFTGRRWLFDVIDRWLDDDPKSRVFWLTGPPGIGKTAVAVHLCHTRGEVLAHHLCVHGHGEKGDPRRALLSIAYQMAQQLPEYGRRLASFELESEISNNVQTIFDNLFVRLLCRDFPLPSRPCIVVIDALDEASSHGGNDLASFIRDYWELTPKWLRLFITSRPESEVASNLASLEPYLLDAEREENIADLRAFLAVELSRRSKPTDKPTIDQILEKSEGIFLYVAVILNEIDNGRLFLDNIDEFPKSLADHYRKYFSRRFPVTGDYASTLRPILDTICAQRGPLPLSILAIAAGLTNDELRSRLAALGSFFPISQLQLHAQATHAVAPFHNTLVEWLTDIDQRTQYYIAGEYHCDKKSGEARLAKACHDEFKAGPGKMSDYGLAHLPIHLLESGRIAELGPVLFNPDYLEARLVAQGPQGIIDDCRLAAAALDSPADASEVQALEMLQGTIRLSANVLTAEPRQLRSHLFGRLLGTAQETIKRFLETAANTCDDVWFKPLSQQLLPPDSGLLRNLIGHTESVNCVAWSPDGRHVISGGHDNAAKVWDVQTGKELRTFSGHEGSVVCVTITPDGTRAVTGAEDMTIKIWDLDNGQLVAGFTGEQPMSAVAVADDGITVVAGTNWGRIHFLKIEGLKT